MRVTFGGNPTIVIPPGAPAISDPVDMSVEPLALSRSVSTSRKSRR